MNVHYWPKIITCPSAPIKCTETSKSNFKAYGAGCNVICLIIAHPRSWYEMSQTLHIPCGKTASNHDAALSDWLTRQNQALILESKKEVTAAY